MIRPARSPLVAPLLAALFMAAVLAACDRSTEPQQGDPSEGLCSIAHLKSLCRIPSERIGLHLRRAEEQPAEPPHPCQLASFAEIGPELVDTYVRFKGVRFAGEGTWCDRNPETLRPLATEHTLLDAEGRTLMLRCPATVLYASEPVPSGTGSLGCVVDRFNGRYSLRPTNYEALFPTPATPPTTYP